MAVETAYFSKSNARQDSSCLIIVEGKDDALFVSALLEDMQADPSQVGIVEVEGNANFPSRLKGFLKSSSFTQGKNKSIAIICDADGSPEKVAEKLNGVLVNSGQPSLSLGVHTFNPNGVRLGLFAMPNCVECGDLEKLCLDTVAGSNLELEAESFIRAAEVHSANLAQSMNGSRHKRKAQVFLAAIPEGIVRGAGQGYAKGYFDSGHQALEPLRNFLRDTIS